MSAPLALERRRMATLALAATAVLAIISALVVEFDAARLKPPHAEGAVLPNFAQNAGAAQAITIATKDATYRIVRTQRGWTLPDRGDYPVARERLAQFTEGLASLSFVRPMTRDPAKFDRLGLGDPAKGGDGVSVQVQNAQGALLANLMLGITPSGLYMRQNDGAQAWALKGVLPPLKDPSQWLDLTPLTIDPARITRVSVQPAEGPAYVLVRAERTSDFRLEAPFDRFLVLTPDGLNSAGQAFAFLKPNDVAAAPAIAGAPSAKVSMRTRDGLAIDGELFALPPRHWLKLVAHAETPNAAQDAQAINTRAAAWAYGLSALDYLNFAPPLSVLARPPSPSPAQTPESVAP
ncbi:MAG: DUF4340 domain-containing protein [Alphaproteobacteria bacterium]